MFAATVLATSAAHAQWWDAGAAGAKAVSEQTDGKLKLGAEIRARYETRTANNFSPGADIDTGLVRTRLSLTYTPVTWLKISGMMQDARAPWYGTGAPSTVRDPADLHEGYFELFPSAPGFGMTVGRMMLNYGEGRLIGTPQWSNLSRTYDHARAYYRTGKARISGSAICSTFIFSDMIRTGLEVSPAVTKPPARTGLRSTRSALVSPVRCRGGRNIA
jgi:hypothetical protein